MVRLPRKAWTTQHGRFAVGIQGAGGLVENQRRGPAHPCPGDDDSLTLTARQPAAAFTDRRVDTVG